MNFTSKRGDTTTLNIAVKGGDDSAFDITNVLLKFTVKKSVRDSDARASISKSSSDSGIVKTDAENGACQIVINQDETGGLNSINHQLVYDLQLTSGENVYTLATGRITVEPDVTVGTGIVEYYSYRLPLNASAAANRSRSNVCAKCQARY